MQRLRGQPSTLLGCRGPSGRLCFARRMVVFAPTPSIMPGAAGPSKCDAEGGFLSFATMALRPSRSDASRRLGETISATLSSPQLCTEAAAPSLRDHPMRGGRSISARFAMANFGGLAQLQASALRSRLDERPVAGRIENTPQPSAHRRPPACRVLATRGVQAGTVSRASREALQRSMFPKPLAKEPQDASRAQTSHRPSAGQSR